MCLNPISIINPHKNISLHYRDRYLLQVPCGKCAECQSSASNAWMYRSYYEFLDCLQNGGFVLFDTLTYDNEHLPHVSEFMPVKHDFPCFNPKHVQDFLKRLRIRLERADYDVVFRYFVSSEYGTDDRYTHRPHYHILFFVYGDIEPYIFSSFVSDAWFYGRTDGVPYKSRYYVDTHNLINLSSTANILRTSNYVTKYVQKSCTFQRELDKRIRFALYDVACFFSPDDPESWLDTYDAVKVRISLSRYCNQFHRQSLHFGETALRDIDLNQLFRDGCLIMPHFKGVKIPIALPTYYKRKLFYSLVEVDGTKSWQLNDVGREYNDYRKSYLLNDLESRFSCVCRQFNLSYDCHRLADYVLNIRGRINGEFDPVDLEFKLSSVSLFNYSTLSDLDSLGHRGLSPIFLGNSAVGYDHRCVSFVPFRDFIAKYVMMDSDREAELSHIYYLCCFENQGKQSAFELKQRLTNVYKMFV